MAGGGQRLLRLLTNVLEACKRTSIPVKSGRIQTRHSRKGEIAARQLVSFVAVTVRHDVKLGEHGPLVARSPNVDETASKIIDKQVLCLKVFESPGVSRE